jgi:hypothetical protein
VIAPLPADFAKNCLVFLPTNQEAERIVTTATVKVIAELISSFESRNQAAMGSGTSIHQFGELPIISRLWWTKENPRDVKRNLPALGGTPARQSFLPVNRS